MAWVGQNQDRINATIAMHAQPAWGQVELFRLLLETFIIEETPKSAGVTWIIMKDALTKLSRE